MGEPLSIAGVLSDGAESFLDIDSLLEPISGDSPTGDDLRADVKPNSIYYTLRENRTAARNNERAALASGESDYISRADWAGIIDAVPAVLREQSKDLELVAWLIEALTRNHGFRGFAEGFALAQRLIERFGTALYPLPDEDGIATQLAALTGLNGFGSEGALIAPLKSVPLTLGSPPAPFSAWQCEQAFETERIGDQARRAARSKRGFVARADVDAAVAETSAEFFTSLHQELCLALEAFGRYQAAVDAYCADAPQPTARIKETLESIQQTLRYIAGDKIRSAPEPAADEPAPAEPGADVPTASAPAVSAGPLDRDAALKQLKEIAAFFRRTEPHSPISYAVEQAVYWSQLSLPELMGELIQDETARQKFNKLAGIRQAE